MGGRHVAELLLALRGSIRRQLGGAGVVNAEEGVDDGQDGTLRAAGAAELVMRGAPPSL